MANDNRYQGDGFTQGDDGAIFGDSGSDPGSISDYDTWDWRQIMAAVNGMSSGVGSATNLEHAASVSSPASLLNAAHAFAYAQNTLTIIAQSLKDQANALAGTNGPWQGDAAEAFFDMMNTFSKQVQANADVLSGGATGSHSVSQQIANNSANLARAQQLIHDINVWYADQAVRMGVTPMSDGLIPISRKPQLVEMMTNDMRNVLKSLAGNYQVTIDSIRTPTPVNSPLTDTPPPTDVPPPTDMPSPTDTPPTDMPSPGDLNTGGPDTGTPAPFDGPTSTDGPGTDLAADPGGFPDGTDTGAGTGDVPSFDPNAMDAALNPGDGALDSPSPFPDGTDTGLPDGAGPQDLAAVPPTPFPSSTSTNGGTDLPSSGLPTGDSAFNESGMPEDFPGDTGLGGADGLSDAGLPEGTGTPSAFPGDLGLESGGPSADLALPDTADSLTGFPGATDLATGEPSSGMPYMPPGGMGAPGAGQNAGAGQPDPSDASGLLDNSATPWAGTTDTGTDEPNVFTTTPTDTGLDLPTTTPQTSPETTDLATGEPSTGMPYMPPGGMGAPGAGQNAGAGQPDPSDASGLLDNSATPWAGTTDTGTDEPNAFTTTPTDTGLDLPTTPDGWEEERPSGIEEFAVPPGEVATAGPGGMPYMPPGGMGVPGTGQNAAADQPDPSDASGLLGGSSDPWGAEPDFAAAGPVPEGAGQVASGGAHLTPPAEYAAGFASGTPAENATGGPGFPILPGAAAEGDGLVGPGFGGSHPREAATAAEAALLAEAALARGRRPQSTGEQQPLAEPLPPVPAGEETGDDFSAWDSAEDSIIPMLWATAAAEDEEGDGSLSRYSSEDEETWTGAAAETGDPLPLATWQPNRQGTAGTGSVRIDELIASGGMMCADVPYDPELEEQPEEDEAEDNEETPATRSAADLLIQEQAAWGTVGDPDDVLS
ncbi:hypothetical protein OG552_29865 [Streptomyces sp. NBC_01476]|uniref:hypothetical protein n=1 Tax=Streptomyces sp. NBC_01476 TaxID=2903881 RepID=UPI002E366FE0|nr:hypothetical protein [Streptomyces sp. NBC_01476]